MPSDQLSLTPPTRPTPYDQSVPVNREFDDKGKRTDEHRPEVFDPSQYRVERYWDNRPDQTWAYKGAWIARYNSAAAEYAMEMQRRANEAHDRERRRLFSDEQDTRACVHCGHNPLRYVAVVRHIPSGKTLVFGDICAERAQLPNRSEFEARKVRGEAKRRREAEQLAQAQAAYADNNPQVTQVLAEVISRRDENPVEALDYYGDFVIDVVRKFEQYGNLSERQGEALLRAVAGAARRAEKQAQWAEENAQAADAPVGKQTVEGVVLSVKDYDSEYGTQWKMVVKLDDGSRVFCTIPKSILDFRQNEDGDWYADTKGKRVRFSASFEPSERDPKFSFGKRPTGASIVG